MSRCPPCSRNGMRPSWRRRAGYSVETLRVAAACSVVSSAQSGAGPFSLSTSGVSTVAQHDGQRKVPSGCSATANRCRRPAHRSTSGECHRWQPPPPGRSSGRQATHALLRTSRAAPHVGEGRPTPRQSERRRRRARHPCLDVALERFGPLSHGPDRDGRDPEAHLAAHRLAAGVAQPAPSRSVETRAASSARPSRGHLRPLAEMIEVLLEHDGPVLLAVAECLQHVSRLEHSQRLRRRGPRAFEQVYRTVHRNDRVLR